MTAAFATAVAAAGSRWSWLRSRVRWSARADAGLALVCFVLGEIEVALTDGGAKVTLALSAALATLPIAWRLRVPLVATVVVAASWVIFHSWGGVEGEPFFELAVLPVVYSIGSHLSLKRSIGGFAVLLMAVAATDLPGLGFFGFQFAVIWISGRGVRASRVQSAQLRAVADRLAGERETCERLAVAHERQRMAGELHDAIAHAVSAMVLQAASAEQMVRREPDRVRTALKAVQVGGRSVISQLQRVLCLLRSTPSADRPETDSLLPEPGSRHDCPIVQSKWADVLLALLVMVFADPQLIRIDPLKGIPAPIAVSVVAALVAIMIRCRFPLASLVIATTATAGGLLLFGATVGFASIIAIMLAMYSVAARMPTRPSLLAAVMTIVALSVLVLIEVGDIDSLMVVVWLGMPWFLGRHVRAYRRRAAELQALTVRLARERDARARLAVLQERARVARELHDSLAHAINVMVLQAGAAEQVLTCSPDRARDAIRTVEAQGRRAHDDLCRLLGLFDSGYSPRAPQPSLARIDTLLVESGLPVTLHVSGRPARLPSDLDLSAYRIVQEGLTNTLKHAGSVPTTVTLDYRADELGIEIRNSGRRPPTGPVCQGGHGLLGMRERTTLHGGALETGPSPDGGFIVRALLPFTTPIT